MSSSSSSVVKAFKSPIQHALGANLNDHMAQFAVNLCESKEAQRRWEILSELHERSWKELLSKVREFVEGRCGSGKEEECWTPVIYGVYGSGKTTMLIELCEWSLRNSIPAARVNLSEVVSYIKRGSRGAISEADLPRYVEAFFWEHLSSKLTEETLNRIKGRKGVLIIDEVEEGFEELKSMVTGRSILRGLADKVRTGSGNLLVVLSFAPSSILVEAVLQYATAWRVKLIPLPSISTDFIYGRYVRGYSNSAKLKDYREIGELVSNALWWLSKGGRPGWLDKLKRDGVIESIFNTVNHLAETGNFKELGLCYDFHQDPALSKSVRDALSIKPVENVPLLDYEEYLKMLERVREELRVVPPENAAIMEALVKLLVCLVGPASSDLLEALLRRKIPPGLKPPDVAVRKRELISMNILIDTYIDALRESFDLEGDMVTRAREYLKSVLQPWSVSDLMIYDRNELKALLEEVLPLLLVENVEEKLLDYVTRLDVDSILRDAFGRSKEKLLLEEKDYYSLRIKVLRSLYKPIVTSPLVGCSKGVRLDNMVGSLEGRADLHESTVLNEMKDRDLDIYPLPSTKNLARISPERAIIQGKNVVFLTFTSIPGLRGRAEKLEEELRKKFGRLLDKYCIFRLELPPVLAQYLMGRIYSEVTCPGELEELAGIDKVLDAQARRQLKELIGEVVKRARGNVENLRKILRGLSSKDLDDLRRSAHSVVGEEHAKYLWLIGCSDEASRLHERFLSLIRSVLTMEFDGLRLVPSKDELVRGFKGALERGDKYLESLRESANKLRSSVAEEHLREVAEFLRGLLELYVRSESVDVCRKNPHEIVSDIRNNIMHKNMGLIFDEILITMLLGEALCEYVRESGCGYTPTLGILREVRDDLTALISTVEKLNSHLNGLRNTVQYYMGSVAVPDVGKELELLKSVNRDLIYLHNEIKDLSPYDGLLIDHYLNEEFKKLPDPIAKINTQVEEILSLVISIESYLKQLREVEEQVKDMKKIYGAFRSDLGAILSQIKLPLGTDELRKVEESLKKYYLDVKQYLERFKDVIKKRDEVRRRLEVIRVLLGVSSE